MDSELTSHQRKRLGVAPLTALDATVEDYVAAASQAGFDLVGLRVHPVLASDPSFPVSGSKRFNDLKSLIADLGMEVLDVEVFGVRPETVADDWLTAIEAGRELGARYLNVVCDHENLRAFEDIVGMITRDAAEAGLVPVLEPVAYRPLNDFARAIDIARDVGCKVELDVLHFMRTGATLDLIADNREMFPILQLCDAPADFQSIRDDLIPFAVSEAANDLQIAESRGMRQLVGQGEAPIYRLLEVLGDDVNLSVEIPNARVRGDLDVAAYFSLLHEQTQAYLTSQPTTDVF